MRHALSRHSGHGHHKLGQWRLWLVLLRRLAHGKILQFSSTPNRMLALTLLLLLMLLALALALALGLGLGLGLCFSLRARQAIWATITTAPATP